MSAKSVHNLRHCHIVAKFGVFWGFLEVWGFLRLVTIPDVNQGLSPILPSGDFPGEGAAVPFRDDIHDKYLIMIPTQYVILLRIERRTRW